MILKILGIKAYYALSDTVFKILSMPFYCTIYLMEKYAFYIKKNKFIKEMCMLIFLLCYQFIFFARLTSLSFDLRPIYLSFEDDYRTFKRKTDG